MLHWKEDWWDRTKSIYYRLILYIYKFPLKSVFFSFWPLFITVFIQAWVFCHYNCTNSVCTKFSPEGGEMEEDPSCRLRDSMFCSNSTWSNKFQFAPNKISHTFNEKCVQRHLNEKLPNFESLHLINLFGTEKW